MSAYEIESIEWDLKKRNAKGLVRKAKEVQVFIHSDYFQREHDEDTPRHKVTISYALQLLDAIDDDNLPGIATLKNSEHLVFLFIPRHWKERYE